MTIKQEHVDLLNEMGLNQWYYTLSRWVGKIGYLVELGYLEKQTFGYNNDKGHYTQTDIYRKVKEAGVFAGRGNS